MNSSVSRKVLKAVAGVAASYFLLVYPVANKTVCSAEKMVDREGRVIYYLEDNGRVSRPDGSTAGYIRNDRITDPDGKVRGYLTEDGWYTDKEFPSQRNNVNQR